MLTHCLLLARREQLLRGHLRRQLEGSRLALEVMDAVGLEPTVIPLSYWTNAKGASTPSSYANFGA